MEPFIAQIMIFAGRFAPRNWAFCDGQLLPISQYTSLYALIGTTYGGDGKVSFALPDLRGRVPLHPGHGIGLSSYKLGEKKGAESVTLNVTQIPSHNHPSVSKVKHDLTFKTAAKPTSDTPVNNVPAVTEEELYGKSDSTNTTTMEAGAITGTIDVSNGIGNTGGNLSHTNIQPILCVNYIIALVGIYPSQD